MAIGLIVRESFETYVRGEKIIDAATVERVRRGPLRGHVVIVTVPDAEPVEDAKHETTPVAAVPAAEGE